MSLKDKLMDDLKSAMKDKDTVRKNAVQMVRASVLQVEKDNKITLDDEGVIEVVAKEVKKRKDVLPEYEKSFRFRKLFFWPREPMSSFFHPLCEAGWCPAERFCRPLAYNTGAWHIIHWTRAPFFEMWGKAATLSEHPRSIP